MMFNKTPTVAASRCPYKSYINFLISLTPFPTLNDQKPFVKDKIKPQWEHCNIALQFAINA